MLNKKIRVKNVLEKIDTIKKMTQLTKNNVREIVFFLLKHFQELGQANGSIPFPLLPVTDVVNDDGLLASNGYLPSIILNGVKTR